MRMILLSILAVVYAAVPQWVPQNNITHASPIAQQAQPGAFDAGMSSMNSILEALENLPKSQPNPPQVQYARPRIVVPVQPTMTELVPPRPSFDNQRFVQLAKQLIHHLQDTYKKLQEEAANLELQKKQMQAQIQVLNNNAIAENLRLEQLRRQYALMEQQLQEKLNEVQKARGQLEAERLNANLPSTSSF